jgi:hypothetical protein
MPSAPEITCAPPQLCFVPNPDISVSLHSPTSRWISLCHPVRDPTKFARVLSVAQLWAGWRSPAQPTASLSLPQRLMANARERGQNVRDDTPLAGFDLRRHGHPRIERQRSLFGPTVVSAREIRAT